MICWLLFCRAFSPARFEAEVMGGALWLLMCDVSPPLPRQLSAVKAWQGGLNQTRRFMHQPAHTSPPGL